MAIAALKASLFLGASDPSTVAVLGYTNSGCVLSDVRHQSRYKRGFPSLPPKPVGEEAPLKAVSECFGFLESSLTRCHACPPSD